MAPYRLILFLTVLSASVSAITGEICEYNETSTLNDYRPTVGFSLSKISRLFGHRLANVVAPDRKLKMIKVDDMYYLVTKENVPQGENYLVIYESNNLESWVLKGRVPLEKDFEDDVGELEFKRIRGVYNVYFSKKNEDNKIRVVTAKNPGGPYENAGELSNSLENMLDIRIINEGEDVYLLYRTKMYLAPYKLLKLSADGLSIPINNRSVQLIMPATGYHLVYANYLKHNNTHYLFGTIGWPYTTQTLRSTTDIQGPYEAHKALLSCYWLENSVIVKDLDPQRDVFLHEMGGSLYAYSLEWQMDGWPVLADFTPESSTRATEKSTTEATTNWKLTTAATTNWKLTTAATTKYKSTTAATTKYEPTTENTIKHESTTAAITSQKSDANLTNNICEDVLVLNMPNLSLRVKGTKTNKIEVTNVSNSLNEVPLISVTGNNNTVINVDVTN